ncbi:MAG: hypothetical protein LBU92_02560, partial [Prevotellaceae bacterium]|nr:hypothetical protein [Prevotellaceae bacterium]
LAKQSHGVRLLHFVRNDVAIDLNKKIPDVSSTSGIFLLRISLVGCHAEPVEACGVGFSPSTPAAPLAPPTFGSTGSG